MSKCGKLKDAKVLFSRLIVEGFQPDVHTYTVLIGGICKEGSLIEALKLFRKMEEDGCTPNACSYNVIIQGFLQHKDTSTAMQLICEMVNRGFSTDAATRTLLLDLPTNDGSPALKNLPGLCDDHQDVKVR
jgi:pentatricopeptide repeat protein